MKNHIGKYDIALIVLDSLRFDVAEQEYELGNTPNFRKLFPLGWQKRHSPGSFTYAAHSAMFAGFLPTPADPKATRERHFASDFIGSETIGEQTYCFPEETFVGALKREKYHSLCIGGVGFFNQRNALSSVFPKLFHESHWSPEMGVTGKDSARLQFELARQRLASLAPEQRAFLYMNVSAIHQPNCHYLDADEDTLETHAAAVRYVDTCLPVFITELKRRGTFVIICSDHGTLYGEDGFMGHRVGHPDVFTVPYAETLLF